MERSARIPGPVLADKILILSCKEPLDKQSPSILSESPDVERCTKHHSIFRSCLRRDDRRKLNHHEFSCPDCRGSKLHRKQCYKISMSSGSVTASVETSPG